MRQRGERADHRQPAHVAGAVVGLQRPDRHQHRGRHAKLALDAREQLGVRRHQPPGAVDAGRDDAGRGVLLEALGMKHAALAAVEGEHGGIGRKPREGLADHGLRDAGRLRVAADRGDEGAEVAAAGGGERGRGEQQSQQQGGERTYGHGGYFILSGPGMTEGHALR